MWSGPGTCCCFDADPLTCYHSCQVAPTDYMKVLLKYVDVDNIPEYLGGRLCGFCFGSCAHYACFVHVMHMLALPAGKSKGSLIDDVGPWKEPELLALVEAGKHACSLNS